MLYPCIVYNHGIGLIASNERIKSVFFPVFIRVIPHSIKPKATYFSIVFAKNFYAFSKIFQVFFKISFITFFVPIQKSMIEKRYNAVFVTSIHKFFYNVSTACMRSIVGV